MRGLHLSDLHLGKRLKDFPLLEEQKDIIKQILDYCEKRKDTPEQVDFIIIAGDIFDKGIPPVDALRLFEDFLVALEQMGVEVFALGGNHDSAERLSFLSVFLRKHHIHLVTQYEGNFDAIPFEKRGEKVNIYMLPYVKPADVRRFLPEEERAAIDSYHEAVKTAVSKAQLNKDEVNILVAHQYITGADRCESEEVTLGGMENVGAEVLEGFDYVALGHIHGPQNIKNHPNMRYCGTPLKYSFSECKHKKSMTILDIVDGQISVTTEPFQLLRDLFELKGSFAELTDLKMVEKYGDQFVSVKITDEEQIPNVLNEMRKCYSRLCNLAYENSQTKAFEMTSAEVEQCPLDLISNFFAKRRGHNLSDVQKHFIEELLDEVQEER